MGDIRLPDASPKYDALNEQEFRRSLEALARTISAGVGHDNKYARFFRGALVDALLSDDGTTITAAGPVVLMGSLQFGLTISPANITVSQNDYEPVGFLTSTTVRVQANAGLSITGLGRDSAAHVKLLINVGANAITLTHESGASTANKRFNLKGAANYSLVAGDAVLIAYDGTSDRWRVVGA